MDKKLAQQEKVARQVQSAPPITPFEQTMWYSPLIQEFGRIVRSFGKDSDNAKQFLLLHPDFTQSLQLVSILEHLRGARFNISFPQSTQSDTAPQSPAAEPIAESQPIATAK